MADNQIGKSVYSDLKIFHHAEKISDILSGRRTAPIYVRLKPTNVCNQNCYYCGSKDGNVPEDRTYDNRAMIPQEKMREIISDLAAMGVKAVTFSGGGEPLVYPHIEESLESVRLKGIDYSVITNGQALEGEKARLLAGAKWVRVSLESAHADTYAQIRGVCTFDRVIGNISDFAGRKNKDCALGINCVVTKDNFQEIYALCKLMSESGAGNVKLSPLRLDGDLGEYHRPIQEAVQGQIAQAKRDFETDDFRIIDKYTEDAGLEDHYRKPYRRCIVQEVFAVIGADCKVYRCHQRAYTKGGDIGSLKERSLKELWYAEDAIQKARGLDACKECNFRCVFDERNILLNNLVAIDRNHVNFI